jgi:hypothetical protein
MRDRDIYEEGHVEAEAGGMSRYRVSLLNEEGSGHVRPIGESVVP